ncbi:CBS domain-containing protein [Gaoshiqia sp. Z1-71]|uniref:CBS domain-containing protein n=1 Tax=Gaoshiqia hydrogeniformans TaxID=3290090 RepID=UPI003BF7FE2C
MAKELISDVIPSLRLTDNGQKALNWMEIFRISHLPVVDNHEYLGLISDKSIYDLNLTERLMGECLEFMLHPYVRVNQHIYEVVSVVSELKISVVPVLSLDQQYTGVITVFDMAQQFADLVAVKEPGGVIVLELNPIDYSLAEIARIVEGNDAKILSLYVSRGDDSKEITVTLKVNLIDLSPVIQTFVRYDYQIKAVFMDDSVLKHMYDDRFELLMKYLNI